MSSIPAALVAGEAGLLAEENAQRLLSIFMEAGMSCLVQLHKVVETQLKAKGRDDALFARYYRNGLASIAQWPSTMVRGEIADIEAHYPELQKLHQFVFITVMSEAACASAMENFTVPPVFDAYHGFLKRLVGETDVQRGGSFLELPLIYRKVVFVHAFRNSYHDLAQKHYLAPPAPLLERAAGQRRSPLVAPARGQPARDDESVAAPSSSRPDEGAGSRASGRSRLHDAIALAAAAGKEEPPACSPGLKNGEKSVLLLNSPATLLSPAEAPAPEEALKPEPAASPSALQEGIRSLQQRDKGAKETEES
jgi:hypothetical protein